MHSLGQFFRHVFDTFVFDSFSTRFRHVFDTFSTRSLIFRQFFSTRFRHVCFTHVFDTFSTLFRHVFDTVLTRVVALKRADVLVYTVHTYHHFSNKFTVLSPGSSHRSWIVWERIVSTYVRKAEKEAAAELHLLLDAARSKKSYEQVVKDAQDFAYAGQSLRNQVSANAARGVKARLT